DPKMHELFLNAQEITLMGFSKIFTCYNLSISRLIAIQCQDVYKIDSRNTKSHRKRDVVVHKLSENQSKEIHKQRINNTLTDDQVEDNTIQQQEDLAEYKRQRRHMAVEVLRQLQDFSNDWDMQRVRIYWNNHHKWT
ncbi:3804_t:CDS:2, partial [Funneliformis mosseae]